MKRILFAGLALGVLSFPVVAQVAVRIQAPTPDQPVFGQTDIEVGVRTGEKIDRVEVFLNGKLMGSAKIPPFRVRVDVGEENVAREFKAVAYTASGASAADAIVTQPVQIMDELNLKLRALFVSVIRDGSRNLSLSQDDFRVYDNGAEQEVVTFGRDELPLTAVLLLDTSESMREKEASKPSAGAPRPSSKA